LKSGAGRKHLDDILRVLRQRRVRLWRRIPPSPLFAKKNIGYPIPRQQKGPLSPVWCTSGLTYLTDESPSLTELLCNNKELIPKL
jgi:hypothetical protein